MQGSSLSARRDAKAAAIRHRWREIEWDLTRLPDSADPEQIRKSCKLQGDLYVWKGKTVSLQRDATGHCRLVEVYTGETIWSSHGKKPGLSLPLHAAYASST